MMASVKRKGVVRLINCAREPEIVDLQNYLNMLGCKVSGAGTDEITIEGVEKTTVKEIEFTPSYDRIEVGTFLFAGAMCGVIGLLMQKYRVSSSAWSSPLVSRSSALCLSYSSVVMVRMKFRQV